MDPAFQVDIKESRFRPVVEQTDNQSRAVSRLNNNSALGKPSDDDGVDLVSAFARVSNLWSQVALTDKVSLTFNFDDLPVL
jgi:hypothetical protein